MFAHPMTVFAAVEITGERKKATNARATVVIDLGTTLADAERQVILATLAYYGADKKLAAKRLGISEKTIYNKLHLYGVKV